MYTASFTAVAVTAAQDLFEINAPADACVVIHAIFITQHSDTDTEQLRFSIQRATASGSGGSTFTPSPTHLGDPAFGGTVEINNTSRATTLTMLHNEAQNVLNGWTWLPTPEMRIVLSPSGRVIVGLEAAPADSLTMNGTVYIEECGG
jgi:hypothetical protein